MVRSLPQFGHYLSVVEDAPDLIEDWITGILVQNDEYHAG